MQKPFISRLLDCQLSRHREVSGNSALDMVFL